MKQKITTLLLILFFCVSLNVFAQENFEETTLVKNIFSALQNQDSKLVMQSLPTKEDILYIIPMVKAGRPNERVPEVDNILTNFKTEASKDFNEILRKGTSFGVEWENITLQNVRYEPHNDEKIAVKKGHIILICDSNDITFEIILRQSIKIKDKWTLMDRMRFRLL
ncbi:hypothetical protein [uncultured Dokdonia sp.]|uniref:hypothetical protein n=1 Tax=uncultured Dokdonia sp. TaxID=575653 RepID=UPI002624F635|nr:hypothetical protein [uncultured Dokdonia sp.]